MCSLENFQFSGFSWLWVLGFYVIQGEGICSFALHWYGGSPPWLRPLPPDRKLWATHVPSPGWVVTTLASQLVFLTLRILVLLPWPWASRFFSGFGHLSTVTCLRMSMSAHSSSQDSESSQARLKTLSLLQVSIRCGTVFSEP